MTVLAFLVANWSSLLAIVIAVDRFVIQIFPDNTIAQGIASMVGSSAADPIKKENPK